MQTLTNLRPETLTPLAQSFYAPTADVVAPRLLGHILLRRVGDEWIGGPIVETEAYVTNDPSCHAFCGPTNRNRVMFGPPGKAYVYLIYGFYHCLNTVCAPENIGEAVLIRAIEPVWGVEFMRGRRKMQSDHHLTTGPGKLCIALDVDRKLDGAPLSDAQSDLIICENPVRSRWLREHGPLVTTTRIGLTKAADWPLRFYMDGSRFVSKREQRPRTVGTPKGPGSRK